MKIIEVSTPAHIKEFLHLPVRLYKNDPNWIRPLDKDIEKVFDRKKNKYFRHGECTRWLLLNDKQEVIGRVASFINKQTASKDNDQPTGGMGFFECINDQAAAFLMFDHCKKWLQEQGMEAMDGPINFGERDEWWGLLVDGFYPPNYGMDYHLSYYQTFFENYGFKVYFKQFTYLRELQGDPNEVLMRRSRRIMNNPDYTFEHLKLKTIEKYTEDFRTIYNNAWGKNYTGVAELNKVQAKAIMLQLKPIIDEEIIFFCYFKGEPIGFYVMIPDLNQIIRHLNGRMDWWGKIKFLWYKYTQGFDKNVGLVFGVVPEHQGKGVESALIMEYKKYAHVPNYRYKTTELKWIGDFNTGMMHLTEDLGCKIHKTHITYRKLFDESKEFKRCPIIKYEKKNKEQT